MRIIRIVHFIDIRSLKHKSAQLLFELRAYLFFAKKNLHMPRCSTYAGNGEPLLEYVEHRSEAYKSLYFYD